MGNMLFDFILHPAFVVFVLIALFTAVVALVIAHRQKQLSAGLKAILISVVVLCVLYLLFMVSLVFLFDSSPPAPPCSVHSINNSQAHRIIVVPVGLILLCSFLK